MSLLDYDTRALLNDALNALGWNPSTPEGERHVQELKRKIQYRLNQDIRDQKIAEGEPLVQCPRRNHECR
jgi:hypothetical protein